MKIKSGLVFNKNSGELEGFVMLVFMAGPIFTLSVTFVIANFPTRDLVGANPFSSLGRC